MSNKAAKRLRREQRAAGIETKHERRAREQREYSEAMERRRQIERDRLAALSPEQRHIEQLEARRAVHTILMLGSVLGGVAGAFDIRRSRS